MSMDDNLKFTRKPFEFLGVPLVLIRRKTKNRTLVEAARTILIYAKAPLFLWTKAVATTCYTPNHSLIRIRHEKTPYELLHDRKLDLSYLHVFGALCYPTNDSEDLGKLKAKADVGIFIGYAPAKKAYRIYNKRTRRIMETIHVDFDELTAMASKQSSLGPALHEMTPGTLSSGLVPQPPSSTPFVPLTRDDWDTLLQPLFNEYFCPPPCVDHPVPEVVAPVSAVLTGSPSSTSVDQDAPSPKPSSEESSSQVVILNNVHLIIQLPEHISKWTKDHPIDNGIRNVSLNGVFGYEVYGGDSKGFDVNPSNDEFRLCNSDEWRSIKGGGPLGICGYGGGGDMVIRDGLKGCLDHRILRSSPILPPLQ
ncbi:retrovirus-related pol polyprotein from transposon TNT 1-94 [Tanacetum coccineum]